jgi:4-amino-4-deoxy-L-arabinose transferase-like glycosyltransferase
MGETKTVYEESAFGSEKRDLIFLLGCALALRILLYKWTYLIAIDGTGFYLKPAQYFASGRWMDGLANGYHPLYPMLVALFSKVLGDFELSGQLVSVLLGTLTVIPIYYLVKDAFGGWAAFVSSLFLAILPHHVAISADFLSDPTYTFFFISAVWLGWEALRGDGWRFPFLAGLATGFAYLTRAEGIGVLLVLGPWLLFRSYQRNRYAVLILFVSFLLVASPYFLYLRSYTGTWTISRKPSVNRVIILIKKRLFLQKPKAPKVMEKIEDYIQQLEGKRQAPPRGLSRWLGGLGSFFKLFVETCHPLLFLLFVIGLLRRKVPPLWADGEGFLLSVAALYALVMYWLATLSYISHRYLISFVVLCLIWNGRGLRELSHWVLRRVSWEKWGKMTIKPERVMVILTAVIAIIVLPMTISPQRAEKRGRKEAGLWIKNNSTSRPSIFTDMVRVNHYAGGRLIFLGEEGTSYGEILERARREGADYLVMSDRKIESICPGFSAMRRPEDLQEVFRTDRGGEETIIVYRVLTR